MFEFKNTKEIDVINQIEYKYKLILVENIGRLAFLVCHKGYSVKVAAIVKALAIVNHVIVFTCMKVTVQVN